MPEPGASGLLSIVPGLGQVANGNHWEGLAWFVTCAGLFIGNPGGGGLGRQIGFTLWMYNMYDAYRDAGPRDSTKYSVFENGIAPYNPLNLIDPIGAPVVGIAAIAGSSRGYPALRNPGKVIMYGFVGLGEEGLFRGFLFPGLSHVFNNYPVGAVTSSVLFAFAHVTGGSVEIKPATLAFRTAFGLIMSWQTYRNRFDLRKSIFAHAWWDVLVDPKGQISGATGGLKWNW